MIFYQRTEMTNRGDDPDRTYGWPAELVGKGIEVTVKIDDELVDVKPDALSQKLGHFLQGILKWHYAPAKSTSVHSTVDPWPLPTTVKEALDAG